MLPQGISQARILERLPFPSPGDLPHPEVGWGPVVKTTLPVQQAWVGSLGVGRGLRLKKECHPHPGQLQENTGAGTTIWVIWGLVWGLNIRIKKEISPK